MSEPDELSEAVAVVAGAARIVVLSGAGISTESGIPDFRGPDGLWTRDPAAERMSNLQDYVADPTVRRRSWRARLAHPAWEAEPNAAHRALVTLERTGRLHAIVTQNIDGLHQRAGSSPALVVEVHGSMFDTVCLDCGGILKSATISFGQQLDVEVLMRAREAAVTCDLMLVAGSSLAVQPAAGLVGLAARAGVPVVICNGSPTPYDRLAAVVLRGQLGSVLPELVRES
jgi:NAD-dependent deacetylase